MKILCGHDFFAFFAPGWQRKNYVLEKILQRAKDKRIEHYNRTAHQLLPFNIDDHVLVEHPLSKCWATPEVIAEIEENQGFLVKAPAGRLFRRNRRFLRRRIPELPS